MIARIAIVFGGLILWGVLLNVYYVAYAVVGITILGISSQSSHDVAYGACLMLAALTTWFLLRKAWPQEGEPKPLRYKQAGPGATSAPVAVPDDAAPSSPSGDSALSMQTCPHCGMRVFRKADGTCPSCRKTIAMV